jgi:hypothetical protein
MARLTFRSIVGTTIALVALYAVLAGSASAQSWQTDEHDILQKDVGTWDAVTKIWPTPNAEPLESRGKETNELLGGLWVVSRFEGDFGGMPFTGSGTMGYDPIEKKYVGTWVDSVTPFLTVMKGDYDPATKTLTMSGDMRDAASGKLSTAKQIARFVDDDTRVFEMHVPGEDGELFKMMEVEYKRKK